MFGCCTDKESEHQCHETQCLWLIKSRACSEAWSSSKDGIATCLAAEMNTAMCWNFFRAHQCLKMAYLLSLSAQDISAFKKSSDLAF